MRKDDCPVATRSSKRKNVSQLDTTTSSFSCSSGASNKRLKIFQDHHVAVSYSFEENRRQEFIHKAASLNFMVHPRPNLHSSDENTPFIEINKKTKRFSSSAKWSMLTKAIELGSANMKKPDRDVLFKAIIKTQSYYEGLLAPALSVGRFTRIWNKYKINSTSNPDALSSTINADIKPRKKRQSYIDVILMKFPTLLHELYRYATSVLGASCKISSLIHVMNWKSAVLHPTCPIRSNLRLTKHHFWNFFKRFDGKVVCVITKPRLTEDQKKQRIGFANKWLKKVLSNLSTETIDENIHCCFLDEKWFYTTSWRKKMKDIPKQILKLLRKQELICPDWGIVVFHAK